MKIKEILNLFKKDTDEFLKNFGEETSDDDCFYVMVGDTYYSVDIKNSCWYHEDDGTVVFRINDTT